MVLGRAEEAVPGASDPVELKGFGMSVMDLPWYTDDPTVMPIDEQSFQKAYEMSGIRAEGIDYLHTRKRPVPGSRGGRRNRCKPHGCGQGGSNCMKGIGIDIIELGRMADTIERSGELFAKRVFSADEMREARCPDNPTNRFASSFAAKEAVFKGLTLGWEREVDFREIEMDLAVAMAFVEG